MRLLVRLLAKAMGIVFMAAAFLLWVSFDYPDVSPFRFGGILMDGGLPQALNWLLVCVLATIAWGLFTLGTFRLENAAKAGVNE